MLAVLATHPIQYHVPLWTLIKARGEVPLQVLYITAHGVKPSLDLEFGEQLKWDIDLLHGYNFIFSKDPVRLEMNGFWSIDLPSDFRSLLKSGKINALFIPGWNVLACWQAAWLAHRLRIPVWIRGDSNDLKKDTFFKGLVKRILLGAFFKRVNRFLCVGVATHRLYESYGISGDRLAWAPHAIDNRRFALQAQLHRAQRYEIRQKWGIPVDAFCITFCGKFIHKKRPADLIQAIRLLQETDPSRLYHLLFVGAGELGDSLRLACRVVFDAVQGGMAEASTAEIYAPRASFVGFLNQSEITQAYVAADALVLPSDSQETWGLVVNEALACGLPCIVSDACGSAEDLVVPLDPRLCYPVGDCVALAGAIEHLADHPVPVETMEALISQYDFSVTVDTMERLWHELPAR
jgi:glycosyltransferase involved in cell wall biosynthesis